MKLLLDYGARVDIDHPLDFLYYFGSANDANEVIKKSARDFDVARMLVQRGATLDLTTSFGARAFKYLLNPVHIPPAINERAERAERVLTYLFQENALAFPDKYGTEIDMNLSIDWLDYPNLKYTLYLHQLGCNIKSMYDLVRTFLYTAQNTTGKSCETWIFGNAVQSEDKEDPGVSSFGKGRFSADSRPLQRLHLYAGD